ncbi:Hypothetical predicted protein, partial [Olea europaea subsp. europaea]
MWQGRSPALLLCGSRGDGGLEKARRDTNFYIEFGDGEYFSVMENPMASDGCCNRRGNNNGFEIQLDWLIRFLPSFIM